MADNIKIPVSADVGQLKSGFNEAGKSVEQLGKTVEKVGQKKINLIDEKALDASIRRLEKRFEVFFRRVEDQAKKVGGAGGAGGVPALPAIPANPNIVPAAPRSRQPSGGRYRYTNAPEWHDIGQHFIGGFGGGFGQVASYGMRGAKAGYRDAGGGGSGMLGGIGGLARGLGIGALAFGAFKAAGAASEGVDMAKERAMSLDVLKRQMGDLGISFEQLKATSEGAASGLGINSKEAAALATEFNKLSRGADHGYQSLSGSVRTSVGVSRAYGLDPSAGIGFFGGMRNIDQRQNNRELALLLAETINRSGMNARAGEVMQAMQSFAASTSRMSLSAPNNAAFGGAYSSLIRSGVPGLTPEVAASILGQANSTISHMGGAGEAGQNFIMAALSRNGSINPIEARALAEGGLFGTRNSVFGKGTALGNYFGTGLTGGAGGDVTTFDAIKSHLMRQHMGKALTLDAFRNLTGVSSMSNAAALLQMDSGSLGGLQRMLAKYHIDPNTLSETGIAGLAKIGGAGSKADLATIAGEYMRRSGKGSLSAEEKETLTRAQGGSTEELRSALVKIAASKDQEETDASKLRDQMKRLEDVQIRVGDTLLGPLSTMKDVLVFMAGGGQKSQKQVATDMADIEYKSKAMPLLDRKKMIQMQLAGPLRTDLQPNKRAEIMAKRQAAMDEIAGIDAQLSGLGDERNKRIATFGMEGTAGANISAQRDKIAALEKQYGLRSGMLMGMWGTESSYGTNAKAFTENSAGAMGHFQFLKGTASRYGVTRGDFESEAGGAARYMADLYKKYGSWEEALAHYNGATTPANKRDYISKVEQMGNFSLHGDVAQIPQGHAVQTAAGGGDTTVHVKIDGELKGKDHVAVFSTQTAVPIPRGSGTRGANVAAR